MHIYNLDDNRYFYESKREAYDTMLVDNNCKSYIYKHLCVGKFLCNEDICIVEKRMKKMKRKIKHDNL